jgi:hypothetical protein
MDSEKELLELYQDEVKRLEGICRQKDERIENLTRDNRELVRQNQSLLKNMGEARKRLVYLIENEILSLGG